MKKLLSYLDEVSDVIPITHIDIQQFGDGSGNVKIIHNYLYGNHEEVLIFNRSFYNCKSSYDIKVIEKEALKVFKNWTSKNFASIHKRIKADNRRIDKYGKEHPPVEGEGGG